MHVRCYFFWTLWHGENESRSAQDHAVMRDKAFTAVEWHAMLHKAMLCHVMISCLALKQGQLQASTNSHSASLAVYSSPT